MNIDRRGGHVAVAEQFLHSAYVVAGLQHVGGERVAQDVCRARLDEAGPARIAGHSLL